MKIFIMRHGTTCWNEKGITQGRTNNRLSKSGIEKTNLVARQFADEKIDIIFCSPLMRTIQTANIINKFHGVKIKKDNRLTEIDQGVFSGKRYLSLTEKEKQLKNSRPKECGMENYDEVFARAKDFFEFVKKEYANKNILIVTHNVVASMLELIVQNIDFKHTNNFKLFDNAQIKCFDIDIFTKFC